MPQTPSIRKFTDYRAYLIAHAQEMRSLNSRWTYGSWAKRLGLGATSSITKIIQGSREPGERITTQLIRYFAFKERDAEYFRDLVRLNKIKRDPRLVVSLMEKMQKEHPDGSIRILDDKTFSVISQWHCLALREMVRIDGFVEDETWISKRFRFKVTSREVSQAIDLLLSTGLLARDAKGRLKIAEGRVSTQSDVASEAIKRYHEQMLGNARAAIRSIPVEEREITSACLAFRSDNLAAAKEMVREFRKKFAQTFEDASGDSVYQVQIQLLPLTKSISTKGE